MTDKKYDDLVCGNCGYDGGRKANLQIAELEKKLIKAQAQSDDTRQTKHIATVIGVIICFVVGAIAWGVSRPGPAVQKVVYTDSQVVVIEGSAMYKKCTESVRYLEQGLQQAALEDCNKTFQSVINIKPTQN